MRGVLLSLLGAALLLWGCGDKGNGPSSGGKVETFDVVFVTDPPGATVYFDGDSVGVTTADPNNPFVLRGLTLGSRMATSS